MCSDHFLPFVFAFAFTVSVALRLVRIVEKLSLDFFGDAGNLVSQEAVSFQMRFVVSHATISAVFTLQT